jgi:hypothetical protein
MVSWLANACRNQEYISNILLGHHQLLSLEQPLDAPLGSNSRFPVQDPRALSYDTRLG